MFDQDDAGEDLFSGSGGLFGKTGGLFDAPKGGMTIACICFVNPQLSLCLHQSVIVERCLKRHVLIDMRLCKSELDFAPIK